MISPETPLNSLACDSHRCEKKEREEKARDSGVGRFGNEKEREAETWQRSSLGPWVYGLTSFMST